MQNNESGRLQAGFFVRLAAFLLDSVIVGVASLIIKIPFWISQIISPNNLVVKDFIFSYSVADIVNYILVALYFIILTYKTGATVGKKVMHLKVVSTEERELTLWEVVYRETVGRFLSSVVANVGYIMIGIHKKKQGLHDMLSDTEVIYYHEKNVYADVEVKVKESGTDDYSTPSYVHESMNEPVQEAETEEVVETEIEITAEEKEPE